MRSDEVAIYEIRVKGVLDDIWSEWFGDMTLSTDDASGETTLFGPVADQPALHGILARVRDLGLLLLSVRRRNPRFPGPDRTIQRGSHKGEEF
jgi:hypothetical protein